MRFADIPGHDEAKERLRAMVDTGHIPHALLIEGPAGIGKFALARAFAQYIHCTNRSGGDSCGLCPSCLQHQDFNHIDTVYSFPVVKRGSGKPTISNDYTTEFREFITDDPWMDFEKWLLALDNINSQPAIYVDEATELLRRLTYMSRQGAFKVVLLWLPERFKEEAANKLLKLIEEPFADTIFVMVSNNSRAILPTIYSRTQRLTVQRYSDEEVAAILAARGISAALASDSARLAAGNVNEALRLSELSDERMEMLDRFTTLMRKAYGRDVAALRKWSVDVAALGREPAMNFLEYADRLLRESFIMHLGRADLSAMSSAEASFVSKFFPFVNEKNVLELNSLFDLARRDIAANGNAKIILFDLAVRTIILLRRK